MLEVDKARTAKMVFLIAEQRGKDGKALVSRPIVAVVRGDTDLNEAKLANVFGGAELRPMTLRRDRSDRRRCRLRLADRADRWRGRCRRARHDLAEPCRRRQRRRLAPARHQRRP